MIVLDRVLSIADGMFIPGDEIPDLWDIFSDPLLGVVRHEYQFAYGMGPRKRVIVNLA